MALKSKEIVVFLSQKHCQTFDKPIKVLNLLARRKQIGMKSHNIEISEKLFVEQLKDIVSASRKLA